MVKKYEFPDGFWWGSATSATQIEGTSNGIVGQSIWDKWYSEEENRFFDEVGPEKTSDFFNRYLDDIKRMEEIGHNTFRFSISWSRLIPGGVGEVNYEAVDFYNSVLDELIKRNIEPFVNLFHFDMPLEMQNIGGWENSEVIEAFVNYAKIAFNLFGEKVKKWFTFNEPIVPVEGGYLYNFHYPNIVDSKKAFQVAYNTIVAHAKVVKEYKTNWDGEIGIILNLTPSYPRSDNEYDKKAAEICDLFFNKSFLDPVVKGKFPNKLILLLKKYNQLPSSTIEELEIIENNTVDILGINYYQPRRVKAKENLPNHEGPFMPEWFFDYYEMPGRKMNPYRGWEIYEKGIYDIMINVKENYGNIKSFISENGMGVENEERFIDEGIIQDDYRIDFIKEHLKWLHKSIEEGCNVKGYHLWSFMDNWSWLNAYKNRYGLFSIDLETQKRTPKKSAYWMKKTSENNGFND